MAESSAWARRSASAPARCMRAGRWAPSNSPPSNMSFAAPARRAHDGPALTHWIRPPGPVAPGLRIGLLGGSFDPAHEGHLYVSEAARRALKLNQVWWLVSPGNPLKQEPDPFEVRLTRARLVARPPYIHVTGIERALHT